MEKEYCLKCGASKKDYKEDKISCGFGGFIENHKWKEGKKHKKRTK